MPFRSRNIAREMATAVAVLAIYILVLLAPLHQAAGLQRDLAELGYTALDSWSICSPLAPQNEDGKPPVVVKCPAASVGKHVLAAIDPVVIDTEFFPASDAIRYPAFSSFAASGSVWPLGQPRAPPTA